PSIGDLLLNCMAGLAVAAYAVRYFFRSQACRLVLQLSLRGRWVVAGLLLLGGFGLLSLHFHFLRTLPLYSQINLDITESIRFPVFRVLCLGVYCINSVLFFLGGYLTLRLSLQFRLPFHWFLAAVVASSVVYVLLAYLTYEFHPEIIIIGGAYWLLGYYFQMPRSVGRLTYRTSIYFFMTAAFCAGLGAWAVYEMERNKNLADKTDFARKLLSENDPLGEYLLHEASENIKKDAFIRSRLLGPVVSKRDIITKVKRHLGSYFDRYEVNVKVFDPLGLNLQGDDYPQSYADYVVNFQRQENGRYVYGTAYDNLYFKPSVGGSVIGEYVSLITLMQGNTIIGFVTVDLQQKRVVLSDVYPGLLLDSRLVAPPASRNYSYAIYGGRKLIYNEGIFNYVRDFSPAKLSDEQLSGGGLVEDGYQHIGVHDPKNKRTVVVSSVQYRFARVFSNFSFLFLILVLVAGGYLFLYAVYYQAPLARTGFSTRIQIYLNLAFFLPLITVSVVTVSLLSANYRENLTQSYFDTAENIADELRFRLDDLLKSGQITEYLASEIDEMARHTQSDVNIFGTDGRLLLSSQNQIYENGLLSPYVNRQAWHAIARQNHIRQQLSESVGRLQYNSVYVGIRDPDDKRLLGILSIPFFDSRAELDEQIIEVLSVILDIFTLVFIGFLALSYLASRLLTVPLQLIAQKLAKTSLQTENEPLVWNSDDEIGLLVGEYNRMVRNLEESKQALARGEKESAWREMAQQVAHEIKNPLTPMKLTLQHLQRTLMSQSPDTVDRAGRSIATLIEQVDTLSDIATSFSAFAKMPIPKEERFDVAEVLRQTTNLYGTDPTVRLETDIAEKSCPVKGDAQLMSRIFTNLIINGIQSVPEGRQPHIGVSLHRQNGHVIVTVADNGTGIPDTIRSKVFLPHFSTKMSGSGIGLAVAKRGVEHAGGQIWFETVAGEGTTFYVQLPVVNSE
nr:HAMP domain-containing histidine kinase [Cytophagales bacterium]